VSNMTSDLSKVYVYTGTYTGNNSQNRAIPHGASPTRTPYLVMLNNITDSTMEVIMGTIDVHLTNATPTSYAMTAMNSTNIYVGTAAVFYGNENAKAYRWVAFFART